jgi:hypothetical protein
MLDVALADKVFDRSEVEHLMAIAGTYFGLGPEQTAEFVQEALCQSRIAIAIVRR